MTAAFLSPAMLALALIGGIGECDGAAADAQIEEATKFAPKDAAANDFFGFGVALSGDTALISALQDDDDIKGADAGSAYVFARSGNAWVLQAKLTASDGASNDTFGGSVALAGDIAIIGARLDDDKGEDSGSAYVFTRTKAGWTEQAKLTAADGAPGSWFGYFVAISGDTAMIGAPHDNAKGENAGAVYVFTRSGAAWTQQAKLTASDGAPGDVFGIGLALSGDTAVIGADLDDDHGESSGAAYVFARTGGVWKEQAKLTASDGAAGDIFGVRMALSGDTAMISARRDDDDVRGAETGAVYVFDRSGNEWTQSAKLTDADGEAGDFFGYNIALSGDVAVITANGVDEHGDDSGAAYFYERSGDMWRQTDKFAPADGQPGDLFGWSVSLSGHSVLIGAPTPIFAPSGRTGSAYMFELTDLNSAQQ